MNDSTLGRLARKHGCARCVWHHATETIDGPQDYGQCKVAPPRTSSIKWPVTFSSDWCGEWSPLVEVSNG